jgi:hypothetical protein
MSSTSRPVIRIIHHLARSGGTLISRCLGCMRHVVLLSEIHPVGSLKYGPQFNPVMQAHQWFGMLTAEDVAAMRRSPTMNFADVIELISRRCAEQNRVLVIRDWTHVDFTGVPFCTPCYRLTTTEALCDRFDVLQTTTVRHPVDQWLSFDLDVGKGRLSPEDFLHGYRLFAEQCVRIGFMRFEDFVSSPADKMRELCLRLKMDYDPRFLDRWSGYKLITGATGRAMSRTEITVPPKKHVPVDLLKRFSDNREYRQSLALLGYSHPA